MRDYSRGLLPTAQIGSRFAALPPSGVGRLAGGLAVAFVALLAVWAGGAPLPVAAGRQAYPLRVEGSSRVDGVSLDERDALEIVEEDVVAEAVTTSHVFVVEMARPRE